MAVGSWLHRGDYSFKLRDAYNFQPHWKAGSGKEEVECQQQRHMSPWVRVGKYAMDKWVISICIWKVEREERGLGAGQEDYTQRNGRVLRGRVLPVQQSTRDRIERGSSEPASLCFGERQHARPPWTLAQVSFLTTPFTSVTLMSLSNSLGVFPLLKAGTITLHTPGGGRGMTKRFI